MKFFEKIEKNQKSNKKHKSTFFQKKLGIAQGPSLESPTNKFKLQFNLFDRTSPVIIRWYD